MALIRVNGGDARSKGTFYSYACVRYNTGGGSEGIMTLVAIKDGELEAIPATASSSQPTITYDGITVMQNSIGNYTVTGFVGKVYMATSYSDSTLSLKATIADGTQTTTITVSNQPLTMVLIPD